VGEKELLSLSLFLGKRRAERIGVAFGARERGKRNIETTTKRQSSIEIWITRARRGSPRFCQFVKKVSNRSRVYRCFLSLNSSASFFPRYLKSRAEMSDGATSPREKKTSKNKQKQAVTCVRESNDLFHAPTVFHVLTFERSSIANRSNGFAIDSLRIIRFFFLWGICVYLKPPNGFREFASQCCD